MNITVFERNGYIGGRTTTIDAYGGPGNPVEVGGSIFVEVNRILTDAAKEFNLSTGGLHSSTGSVPGASLGVWDGQKFVITQNSDNLTWWDSAKFLWKYGLAPIRTMRLMRLTVGKFLKMYDEPHFPFSSLSEVAIDVGLVGTTAATGEQFMAENGITGEFGHDVVQASTRVNYAQNLKHINGLLAMVCMAAEGGRSVEGGNWQIFDNMLLASGATVHLGTNVTSVKKVPKEGWVLTYTPNDDATMDVREQSFDSVILASPHQFANVDLPDLQQVPDEIPYVTLHVTLFTSPHLLSPTFFNMPSGEPAPKVILTTLPPNEVPKEGAEEVGSPGFFSISLLQPVTNPQTGAGEYLYKIFSPGPTNATFLSHLLGVRYFNEEELSNKDVTWIYRKVWRSYPYEIPRVTFEQTKLDSDGLWYTGGMDSFISTMETNSLMGRNIARLIVNEWTEEPTVKNFEGVMAMTEVF